MLKLKKIKEQKKEDTRIGGRLQTATQLRLQKDMADMKLPKNVKISFPNGKDDLLNFEVTLAPNEGYYKRGKFTFTFKVPPHYPHEPPKVKCLPKVYHPNIDLEGNVCLNILREDWTPVLNISVIVFGLLHLFTEPNAEDPLNKEAADVLRDHPKQFGNNVTNSLRGGYVDKTQFTKCL